MRLNHTRQEQRPARQTRPWTGWTDLTQPGQSMVEFALCIPVFVLLLFGTLEVGMLYKTHAAYDQAAQQAVRIAASAGNAGDADAQMLTALQQHLVGENLNQIISVTVFDATIAGTPVNTTAQTNYVYSPSQHQFVCQGAPTVLPCPPPSPPSAYTYWDPLSRDTKVGELDHIGLRILYHYHSVTGMIPQTNASENANALIEPNSYQP